jgi:hypothetical protein
MTAISFSCIEHSSKKALGLADNLSFAPLMNSDLIRDKQKINTLPATTGSPARGARPICRRGKKMGNFRFSGRKSFIYAENCGIFPPFKMYVDRQQGSLGLSMARDLTILDVRNHKRMLIRPWRVVSRECCMPSQAA